MTLWVWATLAAALAQTVRFILQKSLKNLGLSTGGATVSRFLFAAPLALALCATLLTAKGVPLPQIAGQFWGMAAVGGVGQVIATFATVALFSERNFAVGIAFTKTETVLVAAFSALILAEPVSRAGLVAILVGFAGVLLLSVPLTGRRLALFNRASALGLTAGAFFGISAIGYRAATQEIASADPLLRASLTLAAVTSAQTLGMALWLRVVEPGELMRVLRKWRRTALVGITGMAGSLGWFLAFSLQNAAYVRAVGQVELVFSALASWLVFRETARVREVAGIGLLIVSVVALLVLA